MRQQELLRIKNQSDMQDNQKITDPTQGKQRKPQDKRKEKFSQALRFFLLRREFYLLRLFGLGCPFDNVLIRGAICALMTFVGAGLFGVLLRPPDDTFFALIIRIYIVIQQ